jgi:hypothetical protein
MGLPPSYLQLIIRTFGDKDVDNPIEHFRDEGVGQIRGLNRNRA